LYLNGSDEVRPTCACAAGALGVGRGYWAR